ncbi:MAG: sigma-54 dependent transcriptional regulator [Bacteroidales bacterium]|nr:sigma-54 dependent transcriptional regulator [Bacteroidales bacterium]MDD4669752.1 sigma-54 dependent transcriptional regulator [Bacteroidales bacterium]
MILIVDDDAAIRSSLTFLLKRAGFEPLAVSMPKEAIEVVRNQTPQLILMDMNYSLTTTGDEGLLLLREVKIFVPQVPVILMTAWGTISLAVQGMKAGAFDFVIKPWDNIVLLNTIKTALDLSSTMPLDPVISENKTLKSGNPAFAKIIGRNRAMTEILETVERVAPTNASVLITGESGTGKELIAEAIHLASLRSDRPFVKVNLGGISQSLFESEMFGHKKGAFTDAYSDRIGRFVMADHGTIFLDEIGDLDLGSQVKLLRVLQDRTFEVLGESTSRKVDVRVICATNRDLQEMVAEKSFREDLYYRINLIPIHLPALRERREDIPLLAEHFVREASGSNQVISEDALQWLKSLPFSGNVRELKNLVERTLIISDKNVPDKEDFQKQYSSMNTSSAIPLNGSTLEDIERQKVVEVIEKYKGNISRAASELGISRAALYRRMEKYDIHES